MNEKRHFGTSKDGFEISEYILDNGLIEAHFLDYGCIIKNVFVAGKDGKRRDVVLGYDDLKSYEENGGYLGAFVGRVANRIKNPEFTLDGETGEPAGANFAAPVAQKTTTAEKAPWGC